MAGTDTPSQRFYHLDALRAVAMMLGVVLHATLFVLPEPVPLWPVHDPAAIGRPFYRVVIDAIHGFRMPVFFMLSGYFSALLWQRRGLHSLALQRLKRVGFPFLVACFTVIPLSVGLMMVISGGVEPYNFPLWVLPFVWLFGTLGHLWFLWYLLLMSGCFIIAGRLGVQFRHPVVWWLAIPLTAVMSLVMVEPVFGSDTAISIIPNPAIFSYYFCFFVFGAFFYQRGMAVDRWWICALIPAAAAFYVGYRLLQQYHLLFEGAGPETALLFKHELTLIAAPLEAVFAWLMCFGLMGFFYWFAARPSFTWRYLSDASYWMYLSHLPLVLVGQWLVIGWPISHHLKFLLLCVVVTAIVLVTYQFGVRYTFIGNALNGPRTRSQGQPQAFRQDPLARRLV